MPVRHFRFPEHLAIIPIERDYVRIIREHNQSIAGDRDTPIETNGRVACEAIGSRPAIMPDLPAGPGVDSPDFVGAGHVHYAANNDGSVLHLIHAGHRKDPLRRQAAHVRLVDLR